jgi:hypothetical protein
LSLLSSFSIEIWGAIMIHNIFSKFTNFSSTSTSLVHSFGRKNFSPEK